MSQKPSPDEDNKLIPFLRFCSEIYLGSQAESLRQRQRWLDGGQIPSATLLLADDPRPAAQWTQDLFRHLAGVGQPHPDFTSLSADDLNISDLQNLRRAISLRPLTAPLRIVFLPQMDQLSTQGSNFLLKTLEEPPPSTRLVLHSKSKLSVLPTILSRCQILSMRPLSTDQWKTGWQDLATKSNSFIFEDNFLFEKAAPWLAAGLNWETCYSLLEATASKTSLQEMPENHLLLQRLFSQTQKLQDSSAAQRYKTCLEIESLLDLWQGLERSSNKKITRQYLDATRP